MSRFAPASAFLLLAAASQAKAMTPPSLTLQVPNHKSDKQPVSFIVDGESAKLGQYPFYAAYEVELNNQIITFCGSSLISPQFALTAAHCNLANSDPSLKDAPFQVRVSAFELAPADPAAEELRLLTKIIDHPDYQLITSGSGQYAVFDYGVLKWEEPVTTATATPIKLFDADTFANNDVGDQLTVIGLGLISCTSQTRPTVLQEVKIDFIGDLQCGEEYLTNGLGSIIDPTNMICAGGPGIKGSWQGDSGGPLFFTEDGEMKQVGVVSFGVCGVVGIPGVYSRLTAAAIVFVESEMKKEAGI